ncbi:hypothetical protein JCM10908_003470 [Rhodotorula pacifica]|uniref:Slp1p n=1 Tax=Rhodotorula pacifica TaxID=1495444 RepID=UPI003174A284
MRYGRYRTLLLLYALAATTRADVSEGDSTSAVSTLASHESPTPASSTPQEAIKTPADVPTTVSEWAALPAATVNVGMDEQNAPSSETSSSRAAAHASTAATSSVDSSTPATESIISTEAPTASSTTMSAAPPTESASTLTSTTLPEATPIAAPEPLPSASIVEEVPLVEIPPAPELLSFQEWRDRYVVQLDSAGARRTRKAAQRVRQDAVGAAALGANGAVYDGDAADVGSLFVVGEAAYSDPNDGSGAAPGSRGGEPRIGGAGGAVDGAGALKDEKGLAPTSSDLASPQQPLPNVGTGEEGDPLVLLKDRSNYAAFECAAMVHRSSRQSKGASSILVEKKDRYMLTPCSANPKFVDVELCDEIQIDTIVLANFEFFSSTFKHFKASCSVDYPGKPADWHDLGTYRANNARGVQVFKPLRNPHFCRYVRIDFLSHYGSEYYCPVSLLRVYGFTQLDAYRESERKAKALEEALAAAELIDEQENFFELDDVEVDRQEEVEVMSSKGDSIGAAVTTTLVDSSAATSASQSEPSTRTNSPSSTASGSQSFEVSVDPSRSTLAAATTTAPATTQDSSTSTSTATQPAAASRDESASSGAGQSATVPASSDDAALSSSAKASATTTESSITITQTPSSATVAASSTGTEASQPSAPTAPSVTEQLSPSATSAGGASQDREPGESHRAIPPENVTSVKTAPDPTPSANITSANPSAATSVSSALSTSSSSGTTSTPRVPVPTETVVPVVQHHPPPPPPRPPIVQQPQPGESIYGTIMKRLTSLEHNQTIAMHFIEAQSNMLREAFGRVERRLHDIELTRGRQEQNVRQAILDLEKQRLEMDRERLALAAQVSMLSQEVRLGKRLTIAELIGIVALIIFVGFTRALPTSPFLHLASAAQVDRAGIRWRKDRRDRGSSVNDEPAQREVVEPATTEVPPRKSHRSLPSTSLSRNGDGGMKRKLSLSKPVPRRHYAVTSAYTGGGKSGLLRALDLSKSSSRPRTPPARHSSAPPEDVPAGLASALEARDALRRRGASSRMSGPSYRFPPMRDAPQPPDRAVSPLSQRSEPDHDLPPDLAPSIPMSLPYPPSFSPGEETNSEHETLLPVAELASPALSSSNGFVPSSAGEDDGGYCTYSSNDELSPARQGVQPARLVNDVQASSPSSPTSGSRPPKPHVQIRPATSMGFIREQASTNGRSGSFSRHQRTATGGEGRGPLPNETTPEPPPEISVLDSKSTAAEYVPVD